MNINVNKTDNINTLIESFENLDNIFAIYDKNFHFIYANKKAYDIMPDFFNALSGGLSLREATKLQVQFIVPDITPKELEKAVDWFTTKQRSCEQYESYGTLDQIFAITHEKLSSDYILCVGMDITVLKRKQKKLGLLAEQNSMLAGTDQLTNLANRRRFVEVLETNISDFKASQTDFHIGLIDLNGFKRINDLYGHNIGDALLIQAADRLNSLGDQLDCIARLGGDEFAIIYKSHSTKNQLLPYGQMLCDLIRAPYDLSGNQIEISTSFGWSSYPKDGESVSELLRKSDYALYQSKRERLGQPVLFSSQHEDKIHRQSKICFQLENANLEEELYLEFQPIHCTEKGTITAFEALARWTSPVLGTISPMEFISLAEKIGCVSKLSKILLNKALSHARYWPKDIDLHFNLSGIDLGKTSLIKEFVQLVKKSNVPVKSVVFEVTETAVIDNLDNMFDVFEIFKTAGLRLSLDDFGIGYSSLAYLTRIPVTCLKIDKSFTERLKPNTVEETIVKTIIYLCENLKIECIVEGVENREHYKQLRKIGLQNMQGYFFSKPMPVENLAAYILNFSSINPAMKLDVGKSLNQNVA